MGWHAQNKCSKKCNGTRREDDLLTLNLSTIVSYYRPQSSTLKCLVAAARHDGIITKTIDLKDIIFMSVQLCPNLSPFLDWRGVKQAEREWFSAEDCVVEGEKREGVAW